MRQQRQREHRHDDRARQPAHAITFDRNEHVAFDDAAQDESEDQRRPRPSEVLHRPAKQAEEQQRIQVAPLPRRLEAADVDQAEHARHDQRVAKRRELRELSAEGEAKSCAEDIGERDAPDHRIGDVEVFRQHVRPRHEAVNQERAEQDRHRGAARHPERDGRHQMAALAGVGRALGGDHAADVALAEGLGGALFGPHARGRRRSSR